MRWRLHALFNAVRCLKYMHNLGTKMGASSSSLSEEHRVEVREDGFEEIRVVEPLVERKKEKKEEKKKKREVEKNPHNYDVIMKQADNFEQQRDGGNCPNSGFFLENKRKKYWIDKDSGSNCFMIYPRELSITWSEDSRFWKWIYMKEESEVDVEVACLVNVCWLEVHGKIRREHLTPNTTYQVVFVVMLQDPAYGWEHPVNLRLASSKDSIQEQKRCLMEIPRGRWVEITVGHFTVPESSAAAASTDEVEFSMFEYDGGQWKRGLLVKGAIIRPKK